MRLEIETVTFDCADPTTLAAWWAFGDVGWVVLADPEGNAFCIAPRG